MVAAELGPDPRERTPESCPEAALFLTDIAEGTMETVAFWRERETRFLALPGPTREMHALHVGGINAARAHLDHVGLILVGAMQTPDYPVDERYALARRTITIAARVVDGTYLREWIVSGGPPRMKNLSRTSTGRFGSRPIWRPARSA